MPDTAENGVATKDDIVLLVQNALIITMADTEDPDDGWYFGWLAVNAAGIISSLGPGNPPAAVSTPTTRILDAHGAILAPGFISAHSHIYTTGLRGIAASETLYRWVTENTRTIMSSQPEDQYWMNLHGGLDFVSNGVTTAYNFAQSRVLALFDFESSSLVAAEIRDVDYSTRQVDGIRDSGIRFINSVRVDDNSLPEDEAFEAFDKVMAYGLASVAADQYFGGSVYGAVQWSTDPLTAHRERYLMDKHSILNQAHFVETAEQIDIQRAKFAWYLDAGTLGPDFLFGHFVHPTDDMVSHAADSGSAMVWQPTSNGRLGSGVADVPRYRSAGIRIGLGLDDQSCTDISDPFQNMRIGTYSLRANYADAGVMTPRDILRMHTLGSAETLGIADRVGSLQIGKFADFLIVDPAHPDTGPIWDVYATYVFACGLRNLTDVYIGGKCAYTEGRLTSSLAEQSSRELHSRMVSLAARQGILAVQRP